MPQNQPLDKEKDEVFIFRCSTCHVPLTVPLRPLPNVSLLDEQPEKDHIPRNFFYLQPDDGYYSGARNQYLIPTGDDATVVVAWMVATA